MFKRKQKTTADIVAGFTATLNELETRIEQLRDVRIKGENKITAIRNEIAAADDEQYRAEQVAEKLADFLS